MELSQIKHKYLQIKLTLQLHIVTMITKLEANISMNIEGEGIVSRKYTSISMAVIRRLPKYYRYLGELIDKDIYRISSRELSTITNFSASQIRQDLNCFGGFGQQGYGYNVEELRDEIGKILGLSVNYNAVIIGAGNLGQAIANYPHFVKRGMNIVALFDTNPKLIGMKIRELKIYDVENLTEYAKENEVKIGIICAPENVAQNIANSLCAADIKGIWNFAPVDIQIPKEVKLENVHLGESLLTLLYLLNENEKK